MHKLSSTRYLKETIHPTDYSHRSALLYGGIEYESQLADDTRQNNTSSFNSTVLGDAFRALRNDNWEQLSWTQTEVEQAETILTSTGFEITIHTGKAASEDSFKQLKAGEKSPNLIHFATHAYFFPYSHNQQYTTNAFESSRHPMIRSGLILAGANKAWRGEEVTTSGEDGILTAYEIAQMDLSNTELVVLSACDTGLGDISDSDGVFGLQRAFKIAGAKYIIMSLWSVKDKQTHEFMSDFYKIWLDKGTQKTIPEAFQEAQLNLYRRYAKPFNPFLWASFILIE